jgi:hypothetical protein
VTSNSGTRLYRSIFVSARWLRFVGVLFGLLAFGLQNPFLLAVCTAFFAASFAASDVAGLRTGLITPITLFAIGAAVTGIADAIGLSAADSEQRYRYFVYAIDEHLWPAAQLAFAGAVLPVLGFRTIVRRREWLPLLDVLPSARLYLDRRSLLRGGAIVGTVAVALHAFVTLPALGTLTGIIFLVPHLVVFVLARAGTRNGDRSLQLVAVGVAILETARAIVFAYLRAEIIMPIGAFVFGALLGARSLKPLRSPLFIPVYVVLVPFVLYFGALGVIRGGTGGSVERISAVYALEEISRQSPELVSARTDQTLMSRITTFNQLSQIVYLVQRDGYRDGQTLEYLGYAFIPRFLWPEKPLIAKGAWFALEIGQAYTRADGSISNAVAMSIPGELYLNFGWSGVLLGCLLYGMLLGVFWTRTRFWEEPDNAFGSAFGFFLLWTAFGLGADLQLLVTATAVYLLLVAAAWGLQMSGAGSTRARRPVGIGATA